MLQRYFYFVLLLAATVVVSVAMKKPLWNFNGDDNAPFIKFSHQKHFGEQNIACDDCHTLAKESKRSSDTLMANHESCTTCHEEQISNDCALCHTNPKEIVPMQAKEREIIFSHELHFTKNRIACESCHEGLETVPYATKSNMPAMTTCMHCHLEKNVSRNCESCHTDFVSLYPENHRIADFKKQHKKYSRVGEGEATCATCHSENFCQDCHAGTELYSFGTQRDFMTEPSPKTSAKDSPNLLRLQNIHELNYRFSHGIDARSRFLDCSSCHDQKTFCSECHDAGGNITQQKIKPESHAIAGFATLPGTDGGRHKELARRDIESCMSCHDVEGKEPICAMCHQ
jgi:hypothetical protein